MDSIHSHLTISIVQDADEAIQKGFFYREPEYQPIQIERVVVVREGTTRGQPTVDILLKDKTGQKYVLMVTGALLKSIPC